MVGLQVTFSSCLKFTKKRHYLIFSVLSAMVISSLGGTILNQTIVKFPKVASYQPVINGVAGNLVGVQASRLSTALHQQKKNDGNSKSDDTERLLIGLVVPGHLIFNLILSLLNSGNSFSKSYFISLDDILIDRSLANCQEKKLSKLS